MTPTIDEMIKASLVRSQNMSMADQWIEQRHRDQMIMLDRIATALEKGNQITENVVQNT